MDPRIPTAYRGGMNAGMAGKRLPTGQQRPGSGMRQPTGIRPQDANVAGVGYNTEVKPMNRPVTQYGGVTGIQAESQGPGRQIYDRGYYLNALKAKNREIVTEIGNFKQEIENINNDNTTYVQLTRKYDNLIKEVRKLEGELADYNLALDKQRADTKPEDILSLYHHIRNQNEKQKFMLDDLFVERKQIEEEINQIEQEIYEINQANEERLNELDPEQRNEYERLKNDNQGLLRQVNEFRGQLEEVSSRLSHADARLRSDTLRQRAQHLREERATLLRKKEELELQTNESNLPFPEARERLLNRVKEDNADIVSSEKKITELRKTVESYSKQLKEMDADLEEKKGEAAEVAKFEILYQKDKEMTEFIDSFPTAKKQELDQLETLERTIAALLDHMSKNLKRQTNLPSRQDVATLKDDLKDKEKHMNNAETTYARLQVELESRKSDLEKLDNFDVKVAKETKNIQEKLDEMQNEMDTKFRNVDTIRTEYENEKSRLSRIRQKLATIKDCLSKQVQYLSMKFDGKKNQLLLNETYSNLKELEQKILQNEQNIYGIRQFIDAKGHETNYQKSLADCMDIVTMINNEIVKQAFGNNI